MNVKAYYKGVKIFGGAYLSSILSMAAMVFLTGLFSREWPEAYFLEFTILLRYSALFIVIAGFCMGYAMVAKTTVFDLYSDIYPAAFWFVILMSCLISGIWIVIYNGTTHIIAWVFAGSLFHVYISALRFTKPHYANLITVIVKFVIVITCAVSSVLFLNTPLEYFFIYGWLVCLVIFIDSHRQGMSMGIGRLRFAVLSGLIQHSFSRAIDNLARIGFHTIPVWLASILLSVEMAGLVAISILFTKTVESSLQPVVMQLYIAQSNKSQYQRRRLVFSILAVTMVISLFFFIGFAAIGDVLIGLWLTPKYDEAFALIQIALITLPLSISIQAFRAFFEAKTAVSPFYMYNSLLCLIMIAAGLLLVNSVIDILYIYIAIFAVRWLLFTLLSLRCESKTKL